MDLGSHTLSCDLLQSGHADNYVDLVIIFGLYDKIAHILFIFTNI